MLKLRGRQGARCIRGRDESYDLVLVLETEPTVTAVRREEQCLRLTQISTKISHIVIWKYGHRREE